MEKNWALFLVLVEVDGINWKQMATAKWIFFYLKKKGRTTRIFFGRTTFSKKNSTAKFDAGRSNCCDERRLHCTGFFFTEFTFFFGFFFGIAEFRGGGSRFFFFSPLIATAFFSFFFFLPIFFFILNPTTWAGPPPTEFFFCRISFFFVISLFLQKRVFFCETLSPARIFSFP